MLKFNKYPAAAFDSFCALKEVLQELQPWSSEFGTKKAVGVSRRMSRRTICDCVEMQRCVKDLLFTSHSGAGKLWTQFKGKLLLSGPV